MHEFLNNLFATNRNVNNVSNKEDLKLFLVHQHTRILIRLDRKLKNIYINITLKTKCFI